MFMGDEDAKDESSTEERWEIEKIDFDALWGEDWGAYDPHDQCCWSPCTPEGCLENHPSGAGVIDELASLLCHESGEIGEARFKRLKDAERVAACVNAMRGIEDPVAFMANLKRQNG